MTYKVSAIAASVGVTALAIAAVHYRFSWHIRDGAEIPIAEAVATLLLTVGGVVRTRAWPPCCVTSHSNSTLFYQLTVVILSRT